MPEEAKFYLTKMSTGSTNGKKLIGISHRHFNRNTTLKELIEFLEKKQIRPENVVLPDGFTAYT